MDKKTLLTIAPFLSHNGTILYGSGKKKGK